MRIEYIFIIALVAVALMIELPVIPVTLTIPCINQTSTRSTFSISWYESISCYYTGVGSSYYSSVGFQECPGKDISFIAEC
jgi:hypothetical protein